MKKLLSSTILVLILSLGITEVCNADISESVFYDDFKTDMSSRFVPDSARPAGSISVDTDNGLANFRCTSWTKFNADISSQEEKVVLEYCVDAVKSGKYQLAFVYGTELFNTDRNDAGTFIGILDTDDGHYKLYRKTGELLENIALQQGNSLTKIRMYLGSNASIDFDYIRAYNYSSTPVVVDDDNAELNNIDIQINLPIADGINLEDYIDVNDIAAKNVTLKDYANNIYTVELFDDLGYESENTISFVNLPLVDGTTVNDEETFLTRKKYLNIEASLANGFLVDGDNLINVVVQSEGTDDSAILIAALYNSDGSTQLYSKDVVMGTGSYTENFNFDNVDSDSKLELYTVYDMDTLSIIGTKKIYTTSECSIEEVKYKQKDIFMESPVFKPEKSTGTFILKLAEDTEDINVFLQIFDEDDNLIFLRDKKTVDGAASFTVKFPSPSSKETYKAVFGNNAIERQGISSPYEFSYYPIGFIDNCFSTLSNLSIKDISINWYNKTETDAVTGFLEAYGYKRSFTDNELQELLKSIAIMRGYATFASKEQAYNTAMEAVNITYDRKNDTQNFIEDFNNPEGTLNENAFEVYKSSELTESMHSEIISGFSSGQAYTKEEVKSLFEESVFSGVLKASTQYTQIHWLLDKMSYLVNAKAPSDYLVYKALGEEDKNAVETGLVGFSGDFANRFAKLIKSVKENPASQSPNTIGVIYFDDFLTDTSSRYILDNTRPAGNVSIDAGNGLANFSSSENWTRYTVDISSQAKKVVLEYCVDAVQSGKYQVAFVYGSALFNADRGDSGTFVGILDTDDGHYKLYNQTGELLENFELQQGSSLSKIDFYIGKGASIDFDYVRAYNYSSAPVVVDSDNAELNNIDIQINLPTADGINLKDYIYVNDAAVKSITLKDRMSNVYTVELFEELGVESENTISFVNLPLVDGSTVSDEGTFVTRNKHLKIEASLSNGLLIDGNNSVDVIVENEIDADSATLIAALYNSDGSIQLYRRNVVMATGIYTENFNFNNVNSTSKLELYVVDDLNALNIIGTKNIYTTSECTIEEVKYKQIDVFMESPVFEPEELKGTFVLKLADDTDDINVFLQIFDEDDNLIFLRDKKTVDGEASFTLKFPSLSSKKTYKAVFGKNAIEKQDISTPYEFSYYPITIIDSCFNVLDSLTVKDSYSQAEMDAFSDFLEAYGYKHTFIESELQGMLKSVAMLKGGEHLTNKDHAYIVLMKAKSIVYDRRNDAQNFIEVFNNPEGTLNENAFEVYKSSELTESMQTEIISSFSAGQAYTIEEVKSLFEESVFSGVLKRSTHYMQVHWLIDKMSYLVNAKSPINYLAYKALGEEDKKTVETGLVGFSGNFVSTFAQLVNAAKNDPVPAPITIIGGASGGGGGGGFSSVVVSGSFGGSSGGGFGGNSGSGGGAKVFSDLNGFDWAEDSIAYLAKNNVINGDGNGNYKPANSVSRKEAAKMIVCAFSLKDNGNESSYNDVSADDWAKDYIEIISKNNLMLGDNDNNFMPDAQLTREMMATIIYRVLKFKGVAMQDFSAEYEDSANISDYAKEAVNALTGLKIIQGKGDNSFYPNEPCSRAEIAVILYRAMQVK